MEWRALPPVDWWMLFGGVLWSIFWVTVAYLFIWAVAYLRCRLGQLGAHPLRLAEHQYAQREISREEVEQVRGDIGDTYHKPIGGMGDDSHLV